MKCREEGPIVVSDIVYSEFSVALQSVAETNEAIAEFNLERIGFTNEVLFRAGKAYKKYKENDGKKLNVLPDFLIGAQVELADAVLLTNNKKDFLAYFPSIDIISLT